MSDSVAGLLFELYETDRTTAYSNLFVGIIFGELLPVLRKSIPKIKIKSPPVPIRVVPSTTLLSPSRSLRRLIWRVALQSPVSHPCLFHRHASLTDASLPFTHPDSRNDGVLRSVPRLFMLVVTTAMFALGLIALVLETSLAFQQFAHQLGSSSSSLWSARRTNVVAAICATITYFVVSAASLLFSFPPPSLPPFFPARRTELPSPSRVSMTDFLFF